MMRKFSLRFVVAVVTAVVKEQRFWRILLRAPRVSFGFRR